MKNGRFFLLTGLMAVVAMFAILSVTGSRAAIIRAAAQIADTNDAPQCADGNCGMAAWRVSKPYLNLWIEDEPLGYNPTVGPRVSFRLSYQQRGTPEDSLIFRAGPGWNLDWRSYLVVSTNDLNNAAVYYPNGGSATIAVNAHDFRTKAKLTSYTHASPLGFGFFETSIPAYKLEFPDGSMIRYYAAITNELAGSIYYFMGDRSDSTGEKLSFRYTGTLISAGGSTIPKVILNKVIDADGRETLLYYTNTVSSTLITSVVDPHGRAANLYYDGGRLTNIADVVGINSVFTYEGNSLFITNLTTPYGSTGFKFWPPDEDDAHPGFLIKAGTDSSGNVTYGSSFQGMPSWTPADTISRGCLITHPNGSKEFYSLFMNAGILTNNSGVTLPEQYAGTRPNFAAKDLSETPGTNKMDGAYLLHWNRRTFPLLSSGFTNAFAHASLTAGDIRAGDLSQWLMGSEYSLLALRAVNYERHASPDGSAAGREVWYDYEGKADNWKPGTTSFPRSISELLPDGRSSISYFERNAFSNPTKVISTWSTGSSGSGELRTNTLVYAANGLDVVSVTNAAGKFDAGYAYNSGHQVTYFTNALSEITTNIYNARGQLLSTCTPSGLVTTNLYYDSGTSNYFLAQSIALPINATNTFTYVDGLVRTQTDPNGLTVTNTWDALQRLTSRWFPDNTHSSNLYHRLDLVGSRNRLGNWSRFLHNSMRNLTKVTNALSGVVTLSYCDCGALESVTDALLTNTYSFTYDNLGRRTQISYPGGYSINSTYDIADRLLYSADATGVVTNAYSLQGLMVQRKGAGGVLGSVVLDALDRATNTTGNAGLLTKVAYDNLDRPVSVIHPDTTQELLLYGPAGLVAYSNQLQQITRYGYDSGGRMTVETNANLEITRYTYTPSGLLTNLLDGRSKRTVWRYDEYGRVTNKVDHAGNSAFRYTYDAGNRVTNAWSPEKGSVGYAFNAVGSLSNVHYPNGTNLAFYYDANQRLTNMADEVGTSSFAYSDDGLLLSEDGPWASDTVTRSYQNRLRTGLAIQGGDPWGQTNLFDAAWRLKTVSTRNGSFTYTYLPGIANKAIRGSISLPGGLSITNDFDGLMRLTNSSLLSAASGVLNRHGYLFDPANRRTNEVRLGGTVASYGYDPIGQLIGATAKEGSTNRLNEQMGYAYDTGGNLARRTNNGFIQTFSVNDLNQLNGGSRSGTFTVAGTMAWPSTNFTINGTTPAAYGDKSFSATGFSLSDGNNNFTAVTKDSLGRTITNSLTTWLPSTPSYLYDLNGNLTNDGLRSFSYDDQNQLVSVQVAAQWRSVFTYDGFGRKRISKEFSWSGSSWVQSSEVRYLYDGMVPIQERDGANVALVTYTRGADLSGSAQGAGGIGGLLCRYDHESGKPALYHADGGGNITTLADTNGFVQARYLYDPFGKVISSFGLLSDVNTMQFSSKELHRPSALSYYGYRWYDANLQRWVNKDPIKESGGINLYGFVSNGPLNRTDSTGLDFCYNYGGDNLMQPSGGVPYLWGDTLGEQALSMVYNMVPLANNAIGKLFEPLNQSADAVGEGVTHFTKMPELGDAIATTIKLLPLIEGVARTGPQRVVAAENTASSLANPRNLVSRQGPSEMTGNRVKCLTKDMKENGFDPTHPVKIANVDGHQIIIDGHHRSAAAVRAGILEIPIEVIPVTPQRAADLAREAAEAAAERSFRLR